MVLFDLRVPEYAYAFGFIQGDGSLSAGPGRKGTLSVELAAVDRSHLRALADVLPVASSLYTRRRDTNFRRDHESVVLSAHDMSFRAELRRHGLAEGRKAATVRPPTTSYSVRDYWRGVVDADGSIGFTRAGLPFVSLCVSSPELAEAYAQLLEPLIGYRKRVHPNRRDGVHNLMVLREQAVVVCSALYAEACIALPRKAERARAVVAWRRPSSMVRKPQRRYTAAEDAVLTTTDTATAMLRLGRSRESIVQRRRRLREREAAAG